MPDSKNLDSVPLASPIIPTPTKSSSWFIVTLFLVLFLLVVAIFVFKTSQVVPLDQFIRLPSSAGEHEPAINAPWELVGFALLEGPEDLAYHSKSRLIYTGCADGWIKRVTVNESGVDTVVKKWVDTGGRPLGIAFGRHNEVIVTDPKKGLLNITRAGKMKVLTKGTKDEKFKLIDSVDVAENGVIYFTEASYKYNLDEFMLDILEGKPHGRLWSYDPSTKKTKLLLRNLYFANGLAISPDQNSVVFCETVMMRCRKYFIRGKKKGSVKDFIDLPGFPDNIHYDIGEDHYWIALAMASSRNSSELAHRYSLRRSINGQANDQKESMNTTTGGVIVVDTKGNPTSHYYGPQFSLISSGVKIRNFVYCGSLFNLYMVRINNLQNYSSILV